MIKKFKANVPIDPNVPAEDMKFEQHWIEETYIEKPASVKIGHITACGSPQQGQSVFGLGHDQKIYAWHSDNGLWLENTRPKTEDLGKVTDDPFEEVRKKETT